MPEMDGFELCRYIKSTLEISHIPVILLTSRTDERNKTLGYKMGADAFIPKPYDVKQMYALIRSQLGGRFEIKRQYNFGFFSKMSLDQTFSVTDEEFIGSLNSLIDQFISDPSFNEDYILKQTGIKRNVMLKKMKGLLGTDLTNYLTKIKVSIIKDKLTGTDEDLESIAKQTGFASVDAMNKTFKRETGKTAQSLLQQ
jgi:CheY-like chemotaxis protein